MQALSNEKNDAKNGDKKSATNGDKKPAVNAERKAADVKPRRKISAKLSILQDIVSLMEEGGLSELHYEKGDVKIHMKKGGTPLVEVPASRPAPATVTGSGGSGASSAPSQAEGPDNTVKSPMVGTFYRSPAPDAKPFIQEGGRIEKGQVYCIIEAMKLMNEIKAEISGRVVKILVENGQVVEFGQPLLVIEPEA